MDDRRGDWEHGVDENLAGLNTGQRVTDRLLEDLDQNYGALDRLLRGDAEKETDGLIAKVHEIETKLARINAVLFVDSTGHKGIQHDVESLLSGERTVAERWKFAAAVLVAALSLLGLVLTNWLKITSYVEDKTITNPLDQAGEQSKHPRVKHLIIRERAEE